MKILLLAATPPELEPTIDWLRRSALRQQMNRLVFGPCEIDVVFGGLGIMTTAFVLGRELASAEPPDLAIQAGIGGAVDRKLALGEVVNVTTDRLLDLGAEDPEGNLLTPAEMGFAPGFPFDGEGVLRPPNPSAILPFPTVDGGTVNRTTGSSRSLQRLRDKFPEVQVESMEGAAFFYAGMAAGVPVLQLRAISNYVEVRNRDNWKIPEAVSALNEALRRVLGAFIG